MTHSKLGAVILPFACLSLAAACTAVSRDKAAETASSAVVDSLPSPAAGGSAEPNLFAAADGRVYMTWIEPAADSMHALRVASLNPNGGEWSPPHTITRRADFFLNWADFPSLVSLSQESSASSETPSRKGRLAVHWLQRSAAGKYDYDVRVSQSTDGGVTWSEGVVPHYRAKGEHGFASMYAPGGDSVGIIWLDGRKYDTTQASPTKEMMLAHARLAASGDVGGERILDERICDCCQTSLATTSRGPVIVFRDRTSEEVRDIAIARLVDGAWTAPRIVHEDGWHVTYCPVNGPAVAARDERVAVAWFTQARDTARVQVAFSDDAGATFGPPLRVDAGQPAGRVDVELNEAGEALVSWVERTNGESAEVRLRQVGPDGALSTPFTVAASTAARASGFPRMAKVGNHVILAWTVTGEPSAVRVARVNLAAHK